MVDRVLDVRQGELCWVIGTVYMEMGLKPNILDDISKEVLPSHISPLSINCILTTNAQHWIAAPPPRETYVSPSGVNEMMLEDESGRLRVTGDALSDSYVTGCV